MYRCHVEFYLTGSHCPVFDVVKEQQPSSERFTYRFTESEAYRPELAARADVILARLEEADGESRLQELLRDKREEAALILLAEGERTSRIWELLAEAPGDCDLWTLPMSAEEAAFRFRRFQQNDQRSKDLWEKSQFLEATINGTPELIWYKDKNGIHEKVNDVFCRTVGKTKQQIEGSTHAYIWDVEEDDPACAQSEREVMERRETCVSEEVVQTGDGEMLLTTYKSPLYDWDGSVMGTVGVAVNVTRERAYEKKLVEKSRALELLFSTMDCGVMYHSIDGKRVISVNRAALELLDYDSSQELLKDGFDLVAQSVVEEDKPKLRKAITSLKRVGDSVTTEYRVCHKDGKILHILGNVKLMEEDGELFYQRFLLDNTAHKIKEAEKWARKDEELRYQEQMFDIFATFLADNIDDVYMMLDENGEKVEFVSSNVERVLGIPWKDAMENIRRLGRARYLSGEDVRQEILAAMEPGTALEKAETERINPKTGEHRRFQESVYSVLLQGKKKIVIYISDRTKERMTQDALVEALEIAQVANKAKSAFLSSVSHDIRTPMNAIMGFVTLLKEEADNPEHIREYTQKISAASQHLLGLINDVLDMNKIESGSAVLNISELSLAEIIDELNAIIRPQARAKNQTFDIHTSSLTREHLLGDKLRINQILINILSNAVKYTDEGGRIEMQINELPQVDESYSRIRFAVRDNGRGMSEEYQRVIFDPFTREKETALNQVQGTGLGMAITKSLVDLMGGDIRVESRLGQGSTFTVELELRIQEKEEDPRFWERHGVRRMIVADDDENICRDIIKKMAGTGVVTRFATHGVQAVEMIRAAREGGEPYDLMLLDWKMPGLNGLETARLIRKNYPVKIPIFLFTAYDWADIEEEALEVGIEHFLPKPFFMSSFKNTIRRMRETGKKETSVDAERVLEGRRILVVDDIDVNRMILVKILTTLGADCDTAADGQEAVDKFEASAPGEYDLILMDIQMPRLNGYEATRAIRESERPDAREIAVIAMTANAFVDDIRDALESGMDAHISKPIVLEQLKRTIREVFEKKGR
ncbi:MAG: response regulator [Roseburia sp.]|nr:response regulator [Roseburia sp.]MCM1096771.1 response regulator [Ruminococcus flavefaciens]